MSNTHNESSETVDSNEDNVSDELTDDVLAKYIKKKNVSKNTVHNANVDMKNTSRYVSHTSILQDANDIVPPTNNVDMVNDIIRKTQKANTVDTYVDTSDIPSRKN